MDIAAYVLIAEPGAGKTTAFKTEAANQGAVYVTVRNFLRLDKPEWRDATLFLDGLDESRAGPGDRRTPLDGIVKKLGGLKCPPFRLSCRWSDWLAANDKEGLREVSPNGTVTVVRLGPLSKRNIKDILAKNHGVEDAEAFVGAARQRGVDRLLNNPQNLELLAKSVAGGKWPDSRRETFEQACRMLVHEPNGEHLAANPSAAATDPLIEAAGRLCAVQLLAGNAGYTLPDRTGVSPLRQAHSISARGPSPPSGPRVREIATELQPETVVVLQVDAALQDAATYSASDLPVEVALKGRGGTDFRPGFAWLEEQGIQPGVCLYLTDMECNRYPEAEPQFPVTWCNWGAPPDDWNREPWGERIDFRATETAATL